MWQGKPSDHNVNSTPEKGKEREQDLAGGSLETLATIIGSTTAKQMH